MHKDTIWAPGNPTSPAHPYLLCQLFLKSHKACNHRSPATAPCTQTTSHFPRLENEKRPRDFLFRFFFGCPANLYNADRYSSYSSTNTFKRKKRLYHSWQAGKVDKNSGETFQRKTFCNLSAPIPKHEAT